MAASISTIKAGQAKALADYYAKKAKERVAELRTNPAYEGKTDDELMVIARVQVAREEAERDGLSPDEAEEIERRQIQRDRVSGATAYYAAEGEEPEGRSVWIRGDRTGDAVTASDLEAMFLGVGADGKRLDDPSVQEVRKAARLAGYAGELNAEAIDAFRAGVHPDTGEALTGEAAAYAREAWTAPDRSENRVTALDMTLSAPKGVSLLAAFCDEETAEAVIRAQQAAGRAAFDWAEAHGAVVARRGKEGAESQAATLTEVAQVTEMTSRNGDPQLHSHGLASAYVVAEDGRRSAADSQKWHGASAAINAVYLRELDANLRREIGVGLELDDAGQRTIVPGIDQETIDRYSSRRAAINETIAERTKERERLDQVMGGSRRLFEQAHEAAAEAMVPALREDPKHAEKSRAELLAHASRQLATGKATDSLTALTDAEKRRAEVFAQWLASGTTPQAASLATRDAKAEESEQAARARWAADPTTPDGAKLLASAQAETKRVQQAPVAEWNDVERERFTEELGEHLTKDAAGFSAKEAHTAALHMAPAGVSTDEIAATVRDYLARGAVVTKAHEEAPQVGDEWADKTRRYTTLAVVQEQQHIVDVGRIVAGETVQAIQQVNLRTAAKVANSYNISDDQEQLLGAFLSGQRLVTVEGPPGAGKSHVLGAVAEIAHGAGAQVTVLSTKTDLAAELAAEIGADRGMSLQKATMRQADEDNPGHTKGVFEAGYWGQGMTEEQADAFHTIRKHQREAKTDRQRAKADREMARWVDSLPTREDAEHTAKVRNYVEKMDKVAKFTGAGQLHSDLGEWREKLVAEKAVQPDAVVKIDHDRPQVIVVDEAAMTNNKHLGRLLDYANEHRNVQLVMVGDTGQLSPIGRAGGYRALLEEVPPVELAETRRAREEWERDAQLAMRGLDYSDADPTHEAARAVVETYREHARIEHIGEDQVAEAIADGRAKASDKRADLDLAATRAADWYRDHAGDGTAVVMTPTRAMQAKVAAEVQARRIADPNDALRADARTATLDLGDGITQQVQKGERVFVRGNDSRAGLRNGMGGEVVSVQRNGSVTVKLTDVHGREFKRNIPQKDLEKGRLGLAYSATSHKSQGITVDRALYVHDTRSTFGDRHMVLPSMTRGRDENRVLLVGGADQEEAAEALATAMHRSNEPEPIRVVSLPVSDSEREWVAKHHPSIAPEFRDEMALRLRERDQRHQRDDRRERAAVQRQKTRNLAAERTRSRGQGRRAA